VAGRALVGLWLLLPIPSFAPPASGTPITDPEAVSSAQGGPSASDRGSGQAASYAGLPSSLAGSLTTRRFFSRALNREMPYFVYLPPGYGQTGQRYPVLYMLHGNSGSNEEWLAYGLIDDADALMASGAIRPMVIVLPQGDFSYWIDLVPDGPAYGVYLVNDLVRHVDTTFLVAPLARARAIGGLSMGGTGALIAAFRQPDVFGVVGAHSPALPQEGERYFLGLRRDFNRRDPITQAERADRLDELAIWIDIGDEDSWLSRVEELHETLEERGIQHEWHVFPGDHWGGYWSDHIPDYLRFYSASLQVGS
jgi:enterochelin esterase-like enzyme